MYGRCVCVLSCDQAIEWKKSDMYVVLNKAERERLNSQLVLCSYFPHDQIAC